jgi:Zn-dependent M16 (insulinase) family peptidase
MQKSLFCVLIFAFTALFEAASGAPLSVGARYKEFVVTQSLELAELGCYLTELTHEPSGAEVVHLAADDPENFFSIAFRTPSSSSKGEAHILEHTVLTGSKNYPTELFFTMRKKSMSTFMNAMTASDYTYYPAATTIDEDFYNLFSVYFDAVFNPLLRYESFAQEGCRLEFENPLDPHSPLVYKGVVYNEMKGALSSPSRLLYEMIHAELLRDTPYRYNSGGDPQEVATLTHEELVAYHQKHYFANNCLFFLYGNIPLEKHLDFLAEKNLSSMRFMPKLAAMPKQPRQMQKVIKKAPYPAKSSSEKAKIGFSWLADSILDSESLVSLVALDSILMDTDASLLKSKLLQSGLCTQAYGYLEARQAEVYYSICLDGCHADDADAIDLIIYDTLRDICEKEISQELLETACYQRELELNNKRVTEPFGLRLFNRSIVTKLHGGNIENVLCAQTAIDRLRQKCKENSSYLEAQIKRLFLQNEHVVRYTLEPQLELSDVLMAAEKEKLQKIKENLSQDDVNKLLSQSLTFARQKSSHDANLLPSISLDHAVKTVDEIALQKFSFDHLEVFHHAVHTNNVTHLDMLFELPEIAHDDLWLVQLLTTLIPEVGCGGRSAIENIRYVEQCCSGISASILLKRSIHDPHSFSPAIHVATFALDKRGDMLFSLLYEIATSLSFDDKARLKELVLMQHTALQNAVTTNGLYYATKATLASTNPANYFEEQIWGLSYYHKIKHLSDNFDSEIDAVIERMNDLKSKIFCSKSPHLVLGCSQKAFDGYKDRGFGGLLMRAPCNCEPFKPYNSQIKASPFAYDIPALVAYNAQGFQTIAMNHPDSASVALAAHVLTNSVLHPRIREQGGAYGGGANYDMLSGNFWFYSYRDPHIASTALAFNEAIEKSRDGFITEDDVEEAKRRLLSSFFAPVSPGHRAFVAYRRLYEGKTADVLQQCKVQILQANCLDVQKAVALYIAPLYKESILVALAPKRLVEQENNEIEIRSYA